LTAEDEEAPKRQLSEESGSDTFWDEMESLKLRANALHSNEAPLEGQSSPEPDGSQMPLFGNVLISIGRSSFAYSHFPSRRASPTSA
jgi:hypothetical protein